MTDIDRIAPTRRPAGSPAGYHVWSNLSFIHWRVPASMLEPLLPRELTIDTYDGSAWIGLVPFQMSGVRPWWSPPVWGLSQFPETNVRTYVHFQGQDPGVWFFSLDAANLIAVQLARWGWGLNYHWAEMSVKRHGSRMTYHSQRRREAIACDVELEIGDPYSHGLEFDQSRIAKPETLEHFLVERYFLFASRYGSLYRGQVHHRPYPLFTSQLVRIQQQLLTANGIATSGDPCHVMFSPRVDVEVYGLRSICQMKRTATT